MGTKEQSGRWMVTHRRPGLRGRRRSRSSAPRRRGAARPAAASGDGRLRRRTPSVDSRRQPLCLAKPCVSRRPVFIGLTEEELELWLAPIVYLEFYNSLHGFLSFGGPHMVIDEQVMMPRKFNSAASAPPLSSADHASIADHALFGSH